MIYREHNCKLVSSRASNIAFTKMETSIERHRFTEKGILRCVCFDLESKVALRIGDRSSIVEDGPSFTNGVSLLVAGVTEWVIDTRTLVKRMNLQRTVIDRGGEVCRL